jgi:hypothetical protein
LQELEELAKERYLIHIPLTSADLVTEGAYAEGGGSQLSATCT